MIHVVLGTKAQLIKMAPIMIRLRDRQIPYRLISTGQHRATMSDMLAEFGLREPDLVLYDGPDIVSVPQMAAWIARILWKVARRRREIFGDDPRGVVLVHGDTFSTLLGALMGRMARLRVGHVESGLRSFNLFHPFPEELTRLATFRLSHVLYCPGEWAASNVARMRRAVVNTQANTLADTLELALQSNHRAVAMPAPPCGLVSIHRYENIFKRPAFERVLGLIETIAEVVPLAFILHPPTEKQLRRFGLYERLDRNPRVALRPRCTYFDFVALLGASALVVTDGGSIQEETSYLGKPCLLLRKATERKEGLSESVVLSGYDPDIVQRFAREYERYRREPTRLPRSPSDLIVDTLATYA